MVTAPDTLEATEGKAASLPGRTVALWARAWRPAQVASAVPAAPAAISRSISRLPS